MKPTYNIPSYEGLYYLRLDSNLNPISEGYVERLLPNGDCIVSDRLIGNHVPIMERVCREENLPKDVMDEFRFYTNEYDRNDAVRRFREAAYGLRLDQEEFEAEEAARNHGGEL